MAGKWRNTKQSVREEFSLETMEGEARDDTTHNNASNERNRVSCEARFAMNCSLVKYCSMAFE